jgi:signal transduction histidine kinase
MKRALLGAARYIPGIALLALLVWGTSPLRRLLGINVDSTPLIILTMVGTAWYLGRGPGLLVAFAFEGTLDYFSPAPFTWGRFTLIAFNRLLLFTSIVVFTSARRRAEFTLREQQKALEEALARERVARADAEKANRLQDEFLATISHELRTPLNALLGWSSILERKDDLDVAVTRKALDAIARSARAQARIVEDVLDMSRITAGVLSVKQQPVDVSIVVNEAVDSMRLPSTEREGAGSYGRRGA